MLFRYDGSLIAIEHYLEQTKDRRPILVELLSLSGKLVFFALVQNRW